MFIALSMSIFLLVWATCFLLVSRCLRYANIETFAESLLFLQVGLHIYGSFSNLLR